MHAADHLGSLAPQPLPKRLWALLQEPRIVTALTALTWLVLGIGGALALIAPPSTFAAKLGTPLTYTWGIFLAVGGLLGFLGAALSWWWVERAAIIAAVTGSTIYGSIVISMHIAQPGNRLPQAAFILAVIISLIIRWQRVQGAQVDPSRGMPRDID